MQDYEIHTIIYTRTRIHTCIYSIPEIVFKEVMNNGCSYDISFAFLAALKCHSHTFAAFTKNGCTRNPALYRNIHLRNALYVRSRLQGSPNN